ncbi:MAG: hypothetical protein RLN60_01095 [Phycisphaerales bacterium]
MRCVRPLVSAFLTLALTAVAIGDVGDVVEITLRTNDKVHGTVLEETPYKYVIETLISNIAFPKTIAKSDVREIRTIESSARKELEAVRRGEAPADFEDERRMVRRDAASNEGGYVVVPMNGAFGEEVNAGVFRDALERAVDKDAELVIFHLESPGGLLFVLEDIRDVIDDFEDELEVAVYINSDCFSAAAMLAMSMEHFYVGPEARCGAAVGYVQTDTGSFEVDAKFNSAMAAKWRARAEKHNRPGLVVDAMILPESEIYADTSTTPWTLLEREPSDYDVSNDDGTPRYKLIDSNKAILSFTHDEAMSMGIADGSAEGASGVLEFVRIDNPDRVALDGGDFWSNYEKQYNNNVKTADKAIEDFFFASDLADAESTLYGYKSKLRGMAGNLRKAARLAERYDYVEIRLRRQDIAIENLEAVAKRLDAYVDALNRAR